MFSMRCPIIITDIYLLADAYDGEKRKDEIPARCAEIYHTDEHTGFVRNIFMKNLFFILAPVLAGLYDWILNENVEAIRENAADSASWN